MCGQCEGLSERENFLSLSKFYERVRKLDAFVKREVLALTSESDAWREMVWQASGNTQREYLGDVIAFLFSCSICGSSFELSADLYHGGASWRLLHDKSIVSGPVT